MTEAVILALEDDYDTDIEKSSNQLCMVNIYLFVCAPDRELGLGYKSRALNKMLLNERINNLGRTG